MDFGIWLAFIGSVVLFLSTPGPVTVMVADCSAKKGFLAALLTIAGTNSASLVLIALSFLMIYGVVAVNDTALNIVTLLGCLYLLYFAFGVIKEGFVANSLTKPQGATPTNKALSAYFVQGFLVGASNPKDVLFFMAFFPLFFGVSDNQTLAMAILTITWVVFDYAILLLYGAIFARIKHPKFIRWTSRLSGIVLALVALVGLVRSLSLL